MVNLSLDCVYDMLIVSVSVMVLLHVNDKELSFLPELIPNDVVGGFNCPRFETCIIR